MKNLYPTSKRLISYITSLTLICLLITSCDNRIAGGGYHSIYIEQDGNIYGFGRNDFGQLGDSSTINRNSVVMINGISNVSSVAAGTFHSLAVADSGKVYSWGRNHKNQLGFSDTNMVIAPMHISFIDSISMVFAGYNQSFAIDSNGGVYAWGSNDYGQLGSGDTLQVDTPGVIPGLSGVVSLACGMNHTLALDNNGAVWAWGRNDKGQLGDTTNNDTLNPMAIGLTNIQMISAGMNHSLAVDSLGVVWAWGSNDFGQVGDSSFLDRNSPVQVGFSDMVISISAGDYHSIAADTNGLFYGWGRNNFGQIGTDTIDSTGFPLMIPGINDVTEVIAGQFHSIIRKNDGNVCLAGRNDFGQIGDSTFVNTTSFACDNGVDLDNTFPVAVPDVEWSHMNGTTIIDVQANDIDMNVEDVLITTIDSLYPQNGTAIVLNGDSISYTPDSGFIGLDTIYYNIDDRKFPWTPIGGFVVMHVIDTSLDVTANDDFYMISMGDSITMNVQSNDVELNGVPLFTSILDSASNGIDSLIGVDIYYQPDSAFTGTDTIYYMVCNLAGVCDSAWVVILVQDTLCNLTINQDSLSMPSCNGDSTGVIGVSLSNSTAPVLYQWSHGVSGLTDSIVTGLAAGVYTVTVVDFDSCVAISSFNITEPDVLSLITDSSSMVSCAGDSSGYLGVHANGGTLPYTYQWDSLAGSSTDSVLMNLNGGTYGLMVTDNNGCTVSGSYVITEPNALSDSTTSTNPTCGGAADGTANVFTSGGTSPYTTIWSSGDTASSVSSLAGDTLTYSTSDANGCSISGSLVLTEPLAIVASTSSISASCSQSNGSAIVNASGGTGILTITWDSLAGGQTSDTASGLSAGVYSVTVSDTMGCSVNDVVILGDSGAVVINLDSAYNVTCLGGMDGWATVSATGGVNPMTFMWSDGQTGDTAVALMAGTYSVTATDSVMCSASLSFTISEPVDTMSLSISSTNSTCTDNDGSAMVAVSGGTSPYGFLWDVSAGSQTDTTATGLMMGTYSVTVSDSNNCQAEGIVNVDSIHSGVSAIITGNTALSCFESADGTASADGSGGNAPYSLLWSNGQTDSTATGLPSGIVSVTVTDASGCEALISSTLSEPSEITATSLVSTSNCDSANGSITLVPSGGMGGYSYLWDTSAGSQDSIVATGLSSGAYNVTITDSTACSNSKMFILNDSITFSTSVNLAHVLCYGQSTGMAVVTASGGTAPMSFQWDVAAGSQTNDTASALSAGTYLVVISDSNNCSNSLQVDITQPDSLELTAVSGNILCNGDGNGMVALTLSGGMTPYTVQWDSAGGNATSTTISSLNGGNYMVSITDGNGCAIDSVFNISEPTALTYTSSAQNINCSLSGGEVVVSPAGGTTPYIYQWDSLAGLATDSMVTGLAGGTYSVTVNDGNGCSFMQTLVVNAPSNLQVIQNISHISCNGMNDGMISVTISGGITPYSYSWTNGSSDWTADSLQAGLHMVTVTDGNNCSVISGGDIFEPALLIVSGTTTPYDANGDMGSIDLTVSGGTAPMIYNWSNGATTEDQNFMFAGTYDLIVTDASGCTDSSSYVVNNVTGVNENSELGVPVIYPNPARNVLNIELGTSGLDQIQVLDVLGNEIEVMNKNVSGTRLILDISDMSSGMYFINFIGSNHSLTKQFIIQK